VLGVYIAVNPETGEPVDRLYLLHRQGSVILVDQASGRYRDQSQIMSPDIDSVWPSIRKAFDLL
jgi:hypothetical protein